MNNPFNGVQLPMLSQYNLPRAGCYDVWPGQVPADLHHPENPEAAILALGERGEARRYASVLWTSVPEHHALHDSGLLNTDLDTTPSRDFVRVASGMSLALTDWCITSHVKDGKIQPIVRPVGQAERDESWRKRLIQIDRHGPPARWLSGQALQFLSELPDDLEADKVKAGEQLSEQSAYRLLKGSMAIALDETGFGHYYNFAKQRGWLPPSLQRAKAIQCMMRIVLPRSGDPRGSDTEVSTIHPRPRICDEVFGLVFAACQKELGIEAVPNEAEEAA